MSMPDEPDTLEVMEAWMDRGIWTIKTIVRFAAFYGLLYVLFTYV